MAVNKLGIDCETKGKGELIRRLRALKTTVAIEDRGAYHQDPSESQLAIDTHLTEDELDNWLWRTKVPCDYTGTFERKDDFLTEQRGCAHA